MQKDLTKPKPSPELVYLTASAVQSIIAILPMGTAFSIGVFLIVLLTGRLMAYQGSLARAVYPVVLPCRWGWHRVERALERGKVNLDGMFDELLCWCSRELDLHELRLGMLARKLQAIDTATVARLRAKGGSCGLLGKSYCQRSGKQVKSNVVGALVSIVRVKGVRLGLSRRVCVKGSSEAAISDLFSYSHELEGYSLTLVDAGIAKKEQFAAASHEHGLLGRLRKNAKLRCAPKPKPPGKRGPHPKHGPVLHPGYDSPEVAPDQELWLMKKGKVIRLRRWQRLHYEGYHRTELDVLRIDDPDYAEPLLLGTTARELSSLDIYQAYPHRWPIETIFQIGEGLMAFKKPRAWTDNAITRRIALSLLGASLAKAIAATGQVIPLGPWDRKPQATAGRLANHLHNHLQEFIHLCLIHAPKRNYRQFQQAPPAQLPLLDRAA